MRRAVVVALAALILPACSTPSVDPTPMPSPTGRATPGSVWFGEGTVEVSGTNGTCNGPVAMGLAVFADRVAVLIETGVSVQTDGSCLDEGLGGPVDFEFDGPPVERDGSWRAAGSNQVIQWDVQGRLGLGSSVLAGVILIQGGVVGASITLEPIALTPGVCNEASARLCPV